MIPMNLINVEEKFRIVKVYGGRGVIKKLSDIGINFDSIYKIVNNTGKGPVIIEKDGMRVGIGYGMANKIFVEIINEGDFKDEERN